MIKALIFLALLTVACSTPQTKPVVDSLYVDICKPVTPHWVPRKIGGYHLSTKECRIAKYWKIVNNQWEQR